MFDCLMSDQSKLLLLLFFSLSMFSMRIKTMCFSVQQSRIILTVLLCFFFPPYFRAYEGNCQGGRHKLQRQ